MEPTSGQGGDVCLLCVPGFLARCPLQQGHRRARGVSRCGGQGQLGMEGGGEGGGERGSQGMCARSFQKPRLALLSRLASTCSCHKCRSPHRGSCGLCQPHPSSLAS